jgi:hypothetical protein
MSLVVTREENRKRHGLLQRLMLEDSVIVRFERSVLVLRAFYHPVNNHVCHFCLSVWCVPFVSSSIRLSEGQVRERAGVHKKRNARRCAPPSPKYCASAIPAGVFLSALARLTHFSLPSVDQGASHTACT